MWSLVTVDVTPVSAQQVPRDWLSSTRLVDAAHPDIKALALHLTQDAQSQREAALRIHDYVRDQIRFGWHSSFYEMRASEVLKEGVGYCNTKSTLFVALLRSAGIPARIHFVDLDAQILGGLIDPGTPFVDHSYTEVLLDGKWHRVDSYIPDPRFFAGAQARLRKESGTLGYGVHSKGTNVWDGRSDAFSQFVVTEKGKSITTRDYGVHEDALAFYRARKDAWNRRSLPLRLLGKVAFHDANNKIQGLRSKVAP